MVGENSKKDIEIQTMLHAAAGFLRDYVSGFETLADLRWMVQDIDDDNQYYNRGVKAIDNDGSVLHVRMDECYTPARVLCELIQELR